MSLRVNTPNMVTSRRELWLWGQKRLPRAVWLCCWWGSWSSLFQTMDELARPSMTWMRIILKCESCIANLVEFVESVELEVSTAVGKITFKKKNGSSKRNCNTDKPPGRCIVHRPGLSLRGRCCQQPSRQVDGSTQGIQWLVWQSQNSSSGPGWCSVGRKGKG